MEESRQMPCVGGLVIYEMGGEVYPALVSKVFSQNPDERPVINLYYIPQPYGLTDGEPWQRGQGAGVIERAGVPPLTDGQIPGGVAYGWRLAAIVDVDLFLDSIRTHVAGAEEAG